MQPQKTLRVYVDADVLFRAATASHAHTAALVLLRMAEFTLLDVVSAVYTVEEAVGALQRHLPGEQQILLQLIANTVRIVDDPPPALLQAHRHQAHWKDTINLAAAVHAQAHLLVTYNVRDYFPQGGSMHIMTPGQLVSASRTAIYSIQN